MGELKRPSVLQLRHNNSDGFVYAYNVDEMDKYLSEVDKVIAEKDTKIVELKKQVHDYGLGLYVMQARAEKEARQDKYKRCLAMARWCHSESLWWYSKGYGFEKYDKFWEKWEKRWLELAEKFKEVR